MNASLHRFEVEDRRFVIDPETCFCFECDEISWDVIEHYPHASVNRILHLLREKHPEKEVEEVVGELEWLRASKSILPAPNHKTLQKLYTTQSALKQISVLMPCDEPQPKAESVRAGRTGRWFSRAEATAEVSTDNDVYATASQALTLLLGASATETALTLTLVFAANIPAPETLAQHCARWLSAARLCGKTLTVILRREDLPVAQYPQALHPHRLAAVLALTEQNSIARKIQAFSAVRWTQLNHVVKALHDTDTGAVGHVVLQPGSATFVDAVQVLYQAGCKSIELDLEGAYTALSGNDAKTLLQGLHETAVYYAKQLLKHRYFRLEPIAGLFQRIYNGTPLHCWEEGGVSSLAVDASGAIYPNLTWCNKEAFKLGEIRHGELDEEKRRPFRDMGVLTTPVCMQCWARHLCGGGMATAHYALTGSIRTPDQAWCDTQRAWMTRAVAAFNLLAAEGVNFSRVYGQLSQRSKPSLFALARAAFRMQIGLRPIEEADAEWLAEWANWNTAAYFTLNESGLFMGTRYDREMDALHPRGYEQEFVLLRKNGAPLGLLKLRPEKQPGAAQLWLYLREARDYKSETIRKSFRYLLKEAGSQQSFRQLQVAVGADESELADFLNGVGFTAAGVLREALYLHGAYHDVTLYALSLKP